MPPKTGRGGYRKRRKEDDSDNENEVRPEGPPRPFQTVNGLPVSDDAPEYNILEHALSVADSAVLYSSLMNSRRGYTNGAAFDLYWSKGRTKQENEISARDRMNKLTDCRMEIGPHTYDVRFFILKDDEIEKKREQEKEQKKEKRIANKKVREEQQKIRELKKQGVAVPQASKDANEDKKDNLTENGREGEKVEQEEEETDEIGENEGTPTEELNDEEAPADEVDNEETPTNNVQDKEPPVDNEEESNDGQSEGAASREATSTTEKDTSPKKSNQLDSGTAKRPVPPLQPPNKQSSTQEPTTSSNDMMQTPESQMMIANLNAIARADPSLNTLMKIVASGSASQAQIKEFQGFIQKAKSMGPTPYFKQAFPNYEKDKKKEKPAKKAKPPREKLLTTFQEKYVNGADLVFEFSENPNVRYELPKDCIVEKSAPNEYTISFLVIYNDDKIKKWEARQEAKKEKEKEQEKLKESVAAASKTELEELPQRRTRGEKKEPEKIEKLKPKKEEADLKPLPHFSAFSFKLMDIEEKYDPIFVNSFHKPDEVLAKMKDILATGTRAPKYLLWYQVDAYDDEELAENLREQLELMENPPKKYKRRNVSVIVSFSEHY